MTFRGLIKKEKQKQTAVCLFACEEENVAFGVLIKNYTVVVKQTLLRCN
jgi:translation elongation factor EF-1beta